MIYHDLKNHLSLLTSLLEAGDTEKALSLIHIFPDQLQAVLGNADAAVLYRDEYLVPFFCGFNLDNGIGMGKFDGIVPVSYTHLDNYLPDMKYVSPALAQRYSHAPDYFETASLAVAEMVRQVGEPDVYKRQAGDHS